MATIRPGRQTVLLVIDAQQGVIGGAYEASRVIDRIGVALQRARAAQVPVIFVQHEDAELERGSGPWQLVAGLARREGEPLVAKRFNSAFESSALDRELERLGATHLVVCGAETNWCIRATAYGALERGYDLTVVADGHTANELVLDDGARLDPAAIIDDLNATMGFLAYPGRTVRSTVAAELEFDAR